MSLTYEITKVEIDQITVEYSDGSYAVIPVSKSNTREELLNLIYDYSNKPVETYDSVAEVPVTLGETGNVSAPVAAPVDVVPDKLLTYEDLRGINYPTSLSFAEAYYENSLGDNTKLLEWAGEMAAVREEFPPTMEPILESEYYASLEG